MTFIKVYLVLISLFMISILLIEHTSNYLEKKPKSNRFRKWWTNNIVDLDNRFN